MKIYSKEKDLKEHPTSKWCNVSAVLQEVTIQSTQPPLFGVEVSPQSPVGAYTIPFAASLLIQTTSSTSPMFNDTVTGFVDPEFQVSKNIQQLAI